MLISYQWLQSYFPKPLPKPEELARLFTFHAFEVEAIEKKTTGMGGVPDVVLDIKILPDRAHYCLSHRGIVGEVAAITGMPIKEMLTEDQLPKSGKTRELKIKIEDPKLCRRYIGRVVENVTVTSTKNIDAKHDWLWKLLESIGQRSINTVVDSANFVMFDIGQPLHAFDADKVKGTLSLRLARKGETITTLDNKHVVLDENTLLEADEEGPLAIAGIKGGKRAEVTEKTKNLIIVGGNFAPANIRKTATRLNIKTDAQKRFENEITSELAEKGMDEFSVFIKNFAQSDATVFGEKIDVYPAPVSLRVILLDPSQVKRILGIEVAENKIIEILERLEIKSVKKNKVLELQIPSVRLDLSIPEDIVEEIGRLYGYENIKTADLPALQKSPETNKNFYYQNKIREILVNLGFSEVYTYAFQNSGEVELENPLASDKKFLRKDLSVLQRMLEENFLNAPLIGVSDIRIFEIGKVFSKNGEHTSLGIGFLPAQKKKREEIFKAEIEKVKEVIASSVGPIPNTVSVSANVIEINLDEYTSKLPESTVDVSFASQNITYKKPSPYPFIVRDVALFVSSSVNPDEVSEIIKTSAGELLVKGPTLFDVFEKEGRKSLAFRMVFQSREKTLTDSEVNSFMNSVNLALQNEGWQIR